MRADRSRVLDVLRDPSVLVGMHGTTLDITLRQLRRLKLLARVAVGLQDRHLLGSFSQTILDQFQSALVMAEARARLARWELDCIANALQHPDPAPMVALKGCAYLLLGLPNAKGRLLTDVDLLVPEDRLPEVEARLRDCGWASAALKAYDERYYREWAHEIPPLVHAEREMEVDIHHNILQRTARLMPRAALLFEAARPVRGSPYCVLAPADMALHAMTHLFYSGELDDALRDLVDLDEMLREFAARDPDFWSHLCGRAKALDLMRPAWYALRYASRWFGTPMPDFVMSVLDEARPWGPVVFLMDGLVPGAMFARDPDGANKAANLARTLLLIRAHWIRMPPALLFRHLSRKLLHRMGSSGSPQTQ